MTSAGLQAEPPLPQEPAPISPLPMEELPASPHEAMPAGLVDPETGVLPMPGEWQHEALPELQVTSPGFSRETTRVALPSPGVLLPPRAIPVAGVRVTRFRFEGNTLFKDKELAALVDDFLNRELQEEDIDEIAFGATSRGLVEP